MAVQSRATGEYVLACCLFATMHRQGLAQQKNEYGIKAGQILMQNIQERLTGLWPATGASSRHTARFAVSISASLTAGLTTSVDMGKAKSI